METMDMRKRGARTPENVQVSPRCGGQPSHEIAEGPYYKSGSPEKTKLYEEGVPGEKLTLTGYVFDTDCQPAAHAWLDFWQANGEGRYNNSGYTLRGHQYADETGKYILETVVPGGYSNRTPHIHVKLRLSDNSPILTTQLFFPGLASNETDFLFDATLLVEMKDTPGGPDASGATFDFVLNAG